MKVGFIGLGKLGLSCAEVMASAHSVSGYDLLPRHSDTVDVVHSMQEAVVGKDIIFVAVQTPHDPLFGGATPISHLPPTDFDYTVVKKILTEINQYATSDQLVVLISTVLPGTTRREFSPLVKNYRFIYNPYLIAMGSVAWDMVNPEMIIIGTEDGSWDGDAKILADFYEPLMENSPRIEIGTWDEAECIKIFYNTFISAKIGLVNMIQDVAEKSGNINVDVVTDALKRSTFRITGPKYMKAGMGDAGPCHPRDNIALRFLADRLDLNYDLFDAIMHAREIQAQNLAERLCHLADEHCLPIFIHGKAYKPSVTFTEGSYSLLVGHYCEKFGKDVVYVDPLTEPTVPTEITGVILLAHNATITYDYTQTVHSKEQYCKFGGGSVIVDPWREYPDTDGLHVIHYGNTRLR